MITRRQFATMMLLGLPMTLERLRAAPSQKPKPNAPKKPLSSSVHFLVFGDWGTGNQVQKDVARAMERFADSHRATSPLRFILNTGDSFYETGVADVHDPQWQTKFEQMYSRKSLNVPFLSVLGNHDWILDPTAQIAYARAHRGTRWQMDNFYYKRQIADNGDFEYSNGQSKSPLKTPLADIFFIDTNLWTDYRRVKGLAERQMAWLERELKSSKATWKFVVGHHPLYSDGPHGREDDVLKVRALLSPLFKTHRVDTYFCGHDHNLEVITIPSHPTLFVVSGNGGRPYQRVTNDWSPFFSSEPGFASIQLSRGEMRGYFVNAKGRVLTSWKRKPLRTNTR